ncbi:hypothetical protein ACFE04_017211 [Oxalis oulophora]
MLNPTDPAKMDSDPGVPLMNLSNVRTRMDSLQKFLSQSVNANTLISKDQMDMVSSEISAAIQQIIVNGAALISSIQIKPESTAATPTKVEEQEIDDCEIVELDAVELLAEHIHFCDICGKGFKRDANLRMHMRAHGNQFKTLEALAKPESSTKDSVYNSKKTRFSCPYQGCNRNKKHNKFRALKSVICVRNHFKRSHCPKMFSCDRCHKKSFSVVADLKSHLKHCGESKWKCSCGTSFSRKDKLFGHMALFEGHMPAVDKKEEIVDVDVYVDEDEEEEDSSSKMFKDDDDLFDGLGSIDDFPFEDVLGTRNEFVNWDEAFL